MPSMRRSRGKVPEIVSSAPGYKSGQKTIDDGQGVRHVHPSPLLRDGLVDWQKPFMEALDNTPQPAIEDACRAGVASRDAVDTTAQFTDRQHAEVDVVR